ncbi:hypothetical protein O9C21_28345, partial (plasmid) [Klebsiella pneumoniae]|nr:hypothetical protein [Klebsiella pneumoniae]
ISGAELFSYRVKFPGVVEITEEYPLSVSSKLPRLRTSKSRPLCRKRRKASAPGLKGITLTSSLLLVGSG